MTTMSIAERLALKKQGVAPPPTVPKDIDAKPKAPVTTKEITGLKDKRFALQQKVQELQHTAANMRIGLMDRLKAKKKLAELMAEYNALVIKEEPPKPKVEAPPVQQVLPDVIQKHETFSLSITLNEKQQLAADMAGKGISFVLTGAAGTGKTTTAREIARNLLKQGKLGKHTFKVQMGLQNEYITAPSIAFCAFTKIASNNIRRALHKDPELEEELRYNVCTIHKLLEYEPEMFMTAEGNQSMRFVPRRTAANPLTLTHLVIEEASMLDVNLYEKLRSALLPGVQIIFLGDINQLQPVMGKPILSYGLVKLPVVELTEVYRQALDSDIIRGAHYILQGQAKEFLDMVETSQKKQVKIVGRKSLHTEETLVRALAASFEKLLAAGSYKPDEDVILSPFNKNPLGTDNINNWIAQFLGTKRKAVVHEVIAGRRKLYLAKDDRVMVDKKYGYITDIKMNPKYIGAIFQPASADLSRFGIRIFGNSAVNKEVDEEDLFVGYENLNIDEDPQEEKLREASHIVTIEYDDGVKENLNAVGEFAQQTFSLGYALTVHKSQGSEWRKVYLVLHPNHAVMLHRELLYTACTRARESLEIIANDKTLTRAIENARIKGKSLEEKIEYFNSGALDASTIAITPDEIQEG